MISKKYFFLILFPLTSILLPLPCLYAEDVRLSTYYPSPFGNYRQIQVQDASNATLTTYTQGLLQAGINIITDFVAGNFTPGIFWSTTGNNPLLPKAGIWMRINAAGTGSLLYFGTSNNFGVGGGITNNGLMIDQGGNVLIGTLGILEGGANPAFRTFFQGSDQVADVIYSLPAVQGIANTVLANDGNGVLTWAPPGQVNAGVNCNTALGVNALISNTTGANNTAVGCAALRLNTNGAQNTAVGSQALRLNTISSGSTALGFSALERSTAAPNTAVGASALWQNTLGVENTAVGSIALGANVGGAFNTAVGHNVMLNNTTGERNTAMGRLALGTNVSGNNNTALGSQTLFLNNTGVENTAVGSLALNNNTNNRNTALGFRALLSNTTGNNNTAVGFEAGDVNTIGSNNIFIGQSARPTVNNLSNAIAIGSNAQVAANNSLVLGGTGANAVSVGIGTTTPTRRLHVVGDAGKTVGGGTWDNLSDVRLKQNIQPIGGALDKMLLLRGVTFEWKDPVKIGDRPGQHMGMIAQEVEKVFPEWVKQDAEGLRWLSPEGLIPLMIESIKDLHEENKQLRSKMNDLETKNTVRNF